ncbi:MAG: site-specific integrase, partial [Geminicoccaceae bacterium]
MNELISRPLGDVSGPSPARLTAPALIAAAGERAEKRFFEFFTANIRNPNTRRAYGRAVADFCAWCELHRIALPQIEPILVAAYVETISQRLSPPSVKLHLAAIHM